MLEWLETVPLWSMIAVAYGIWAIAAAIGILVQRRPPVATLAWLLALLLLPGVGALVYVAFGPRKVRRRTLRYLAASNQIAQSTVAHLHATRSDVPFEGDDAASHLVKLIDAAGEGTPVRAARVTLLGDGDATYDALERAVREAAHHLHLEYYIWEPDAAGTWLRDLLCERARAGVVVRVLIDALGSPAANRAFWAPLSAAGGEVVSFNPPRLLRRRLQFANFRTHRKLVVCDGRVGFLGGVNISALHSERLSGRRAWRDTHLQVVGEPVRKLQRVFLEDWIFAKDSVRPRGVDVPAYFPELHDAQGPWTHIIASGPDDDRTAIHKFYFGAINEARARIWMTTPYFVPDEPIETALAAAALRGVDVRLLVPVRGDSRLVTAAAQSYYDGMTAAGVRVYRYGPPMLHAKTLVVDDTIAVVGSANVDNRSFRLNFELIAALYDRGLAGMLAAQFERDLGHARLYRKPSRRRLRRLSSMYDRFVESLARLFSPVL